MLLLLEERVSKFSLYRENSYPLKMGTSSSSGLRILCLQSLTCCRLRAALSVYDALVITGDIAEGESVCGYLRTLAA